jgi:hypothetical protein
VFAYGKRLYGGETPVDCRLTKPTVANARMDEVLARDAAQVQYHEWLTDRFPRTVATAREFCLRSSVHAADS